MRIGGSTGPEIEEVAEIPGDFDFVEISIGEQEIEPEEIDVEQLRSDLEEKDLGLIIHLPFRQPLASTVEEFNQALLEYYDSLLEFSSELEAEKAVVHCNIRHGQDEDEVREKFRQQVERVDELGQKHGVEIVFENIPFGKSRAADLMELGEILSELDVSMCFDIGHAYVEEDQEGIEEFLEEYLDVISHFHLQDSMGHDDHVAIGHGEIDFEAVAGYFQEFDGTATLEIFTSDYEYEAISKRKFLEAIEN